MKASCWIHRAPTRLGWSRSRCPIQNPWNGDCGISPDLNGIRPDLFEHVEIVLMAGLPHALENADIPPRNERHTYAQHRFKSIRTHQRSVPRMSCPPVVAHDDGARDIQRIEQSNQITGGM